MKKPTFALYQDYLLSDDSDKARDLYAKSRYGSIVDKRVKLAMVEGLYLLEKNKISITNLRHKEIDFEQVLNKASRINKLAARDFAIYKDLRNKGYVVKTGLKFGAEFRVYDKGVKPGQEHAKWIVIAAHENEKLSWFDFSSKARVSNSTKKKLLLAIVDADDSILYYEVTRTTP